MKKCSPFGLEVVRGLHNTPMKLSPEERIVLLISQPVPSDMVMQEVQTILSDTARPLDYDRLIQLATLNQVTPLLYKNLASIQIVPALITERLRSTI
ncbi:MAG: hypothetical protein HZB62_07370 [Nitrospirae bacterium]|nr:hypothetical protein [Nitrospirota bacterium]